jgi:DNA repair exonuclease SbcCD nuclease subunit
LETAIEQWKELGPERIVFTGDLVHSKNQMTPELIEMVRWLLTECSSIAKTIIIPGNHDFLVNNTERLDALSPIINSLNSENIVYYKDRGVYEDDNISWCVYSQYQGNKRPEFIKNDNIHIGLFHGVIKGAKTDIGYDFDNGHSMEDFTGLDMVMCADIHKHQNVGNDELPIVFSSSMIQQDFGETPDKHGFVEWDVLNKKFELIELNNEWGFYTIQPNEEELKVILEKEEINQE